jgi:hypothetical protein
MLYANYLKLGARPAVSVGGQPVPYKQYKRICIYVGAYSRIER